MVTIKVQSVTSPNIFDSRRIEVVNAVGIPVGKGGRVVDYKGQPAKTNKVLQKVVTCRMNKDKALQANEVPDSIKKVIRGEGKKKEKVEQGAVTWLI